MRSIKTSTPAKSVVAEAAAGNVKATKGSNILNMPGTGKEAGEALGEDVWQASQGEGSKWAGYFQRILGLDLEGVKAFRSTLNAHKESVAALERANPGGPKTNFVRISEAMTVSAARRDGMTIQNVVDGWNSKGIGEPRTAAQMPHAWIVAYSRKFKNDKRGKAPTARVELTAEQLLQRYVVNHFAVDLKTDAQVRKAIEHAERVVAELKAKVNSRAAVETFLKPAKVQKAEEQKADDKRRVAEAIKAGPTPAPVILPPVKKASISRTHVA